MFARVFSLDLSEAELPPEDYPSLSAFFVRRLREGAREWPDDARVLSSPADGILGRFGSLERGTALQAKGIPYGVAELIGDTGRVQRFESGVFLTIYLSPRHYHRVHAPCAARLHTGRVIPGRLLPVHPGAVARVRGLFSGNERFITLMKASGVDVAVVAVGAYNVGSISADFDPAWGMGGVGGVTNRGRGRTVTRVYDPMLELGSGDPLVSFHLGSTVILLVGQGTGLPPRLDPTLREGSEVRLGTPLLVGPLGSAAIDRGPASDSRRAE